tara:strand:+ start:1475 stop:2500 length:1026 start_codon:yes stop_codon:yes gene_type:complete
MAISLSRLKTRGLQQSVAERLAKQYASESGKAKKRRGWKGLLGSIAGTGIGTGLGALLGIASGGLLAPLVMGAGQMLGKKLAHEATRGMAADKSKIGTSDPYGFGSEQTKRLQDRLGGEMATDPFSERGGLGKELLSSYIAAGASGKLGLGKLFKKGGLKGLTAKENLFSKAGLFGTEASGLEGLKLGAKSLFGGEDAVAKYLERGVSEEVSPSSLIDSSYDKTTGLSELYPDWSGAGVSEESVKNIFEPSPMDFQSDYENFLTTPKQSIMQSHYQSVDWNDPKIQDAKRRAEKDLDSLRKQYYDGGIVSGSPTISNYFESKGLSLGGSNKKSLAEMLERR